MPLNFPINPSVNDTYSFGGKTWIWTGEYWRLSSTGAINDIPIGNITPSTGAFTELTADSGNFSGNVTAAYFIGDGSQLTGISGGGSFGVTALDFTGDGSTAQFTITEGYTANTVMVFENGVAQAPVTDYTVSGNVLTFTNAPGSGVIIQARLFSGGGEAGNVDLSAVAQSITPAANITYDLGNTTNRWNDIWLANSTIYLGEASISASGQELILPAQVAIGNATIDGSSGGLVLPANSTIGGASVATPRISAIDYPGDDTAADPAGGQTIGVVGSGFQNGASVIVDGTTASVVTFVSDTELQFVSAAKAAGSYTVYVVNPDGGTGIYVPGMQYSGVPVWQSPPAGSLGEIYETQAIANTFVATSDSAVTYSLFSGVLPPGSTLNGATGTLSGTANLTAGNPVTYNFTIRATDAELQDTDRSFSLTIDPDVITWVTPTEDGVVTVAANVASSTALVATSAVGSAIDYSANALPTGLSLSGNTIAGTATVLGNTSVALTATGNTTTRSSTITVTFVVELGSDPYFNQTVLLLSANASPSFISDASNNSFNITPVGDTRPSAFSPYNTAWSNYFDGTGDYLKTSIDNSLLLGDSDFTLECWFIRLSGDTYERSLISSRLGGVYNGINLQMQASGTSTVLATTTGSSWAVNMSISSAYVPAIGVWAHVALVRNNTSLKVYIDGRQVGSTTLTGSLYQSENSFHIGNGGFAWHGYISNARITKQAIYTGGTANGDQVFSPPTEPLGRTQNAGTNIAAITDSSNVVLLTCQSNRFRDASINNLAITRNGDVKVTAFAPFTDTDTSTGSGYFDGTGDYLTVPDNAAFDLPGDFTAEFFVYATAGNARRLFQLGDQRSSYNGLLIYSTTGNLIVVYVNGAVVITGPTLVPYQWVHVACVREGTGSNNLKLYVNGSLAGQVTNTVSFTGVAGNGISLGAEYNGSFAATLETYISDFRLVKGTAVYTSNFTPPTAPLTAISGTSLLTLQNRIGYNNSQFVDTSGNRFNITRNGNATQGTFSPFSLAAGQWSNYFDGTTDYLTVASNAAFDFPGDFTIEFLLWLPNITNTTYQRIVTRGGYQTGTSDWLVACRPSERAIFFQYGDPNVTLSVTNVFSASTWHHVAISRSGSTLRIFVDGVQGTSATVSVNFTNTKVLSIGTNSNLGEYFEGYLSNLRVVKGTAVYTSAFTPSTTPLTNITNTSLLTCQSNRFVDNSTNAFAITRNGDVRVTAFSPFAPSAAYDPAVNGGSGYFDGTGDYLNGIGTTSSFNFLHNSSALFTLQMWVYLAVGGSSRILIDTTNNSGLSVGMVVNSNASNQISMVITTGTTGNFVFSGNSTGSLTVGAWNHVAITYNQSLANTNAVFYINGVQSGTGNKTAVTPSGSNASFALACGASASGASVMNGYISNLRLDNSIESVTLPTAPLTAITNTSLLCNFTNGGITDATGRNNLETLGNSRQDTSIKKYGTSSISLPNTTSGTSRLIAAHAPWLNFPRAFTFEAWVYPIDLSGTLHSILGKYGSWYWAIYGGANSGLVRLFGSGGSVMVTSAAGAVVVNQWQHLALTRDSSNNLRIFVNGTQSGSTNNSSDALTNVVNLSIGTYAPDQTSYDWRGYIDDLRITQGIARYTANFTPPTEPFPQS